jgi:hypothetical protein
LQPARFVANRFVVAAVVLSIVLQLLAAHYEPLAELLRVTSVGWGDWGLIIGCAAVPVLVGQAVKAHRHGRSES